MSVKKFLILTAAGVASLGATAAMAGGPDVMAAPAPVDSYFYLDGSVGYAFQDYTNQFGTAATLFGTNTSGGVAWGADFGYMFNQYIGLELGWVDLPSADQHFVTVAGAQATVDFKSVGAAWGVVKLVAPLTDSFDAFFKFGVSYRYGTLVWDVRPVGTAFVPGTTRVREWRPVFGAGFTYNFAEDWMAGIQWMHFMGNTSYTQAASAATLVLSTIVPPSDVLSFNIGYKFTV